jgi:DNA replication protein DnaC
MTIAAEENDAVTGALKLLLRSFRLRGFEENYALIADHANTESLSYESFLYELSKVEAEERRNRKIERRLKESRLPRDKTLETYDLSRVPSVSKQLVAQLCDGTLVDRAENVLAFGNPGTGKTHLLCGIAHELVRNGRSVFFTQAYALVQHLVAAKRDLRLPQEIRRLDRFDALLIDDLGYVQQDRAEMDVLFTLFAERYERRTIMITSNLVFSKWDQIFRDAMTTAAAIDRLVHHARILELNTESFRAAKAHDRKRRRGEPDESVTRRGEPLPPRGEGLPAPPEAVPP